jgi:hypothetical protein
MKFHFVRHGESKANSAHILSPTAAWIMLPLILKNISTDFAQSHTPVFLSMIEAETRVNGLTCLSWDGLSEFTVLE